MLKKIWIFLRWGVGLPLELTPATAGFPLEVQGYPRKAPESPGPIPRCLGLVPGSPGPLRGSPRPNSENPKPVMCVEQFHHEKIIVLHSLIVRTLSKTICFLCDAQIEKNKKSVPGRATRRIVKIALCFKNPGTIRL